MRARDIDWKKQLTVPNVLSLIRLFLVPVMAYYILNMDEHTLKGFLLFLAIWLTDALDGFIARHFNQVSEVGKVLDPLVDKVFQITTAYCLYLVGRLPLFVLVIMLVKELVMIIGGIFLFRRQDIVVSAEWFGKLTTILFVAAFSFALLVPASGLHWIAWAFVVPISFALFSLFSYTRKFIAAVRKTPGNSPADAPHS